MQTTLANNNQDSSLIIFESARKSLFKFWLQEVYVVLNRLKEALLKSLLWSLQWSAYLKINPWLHNDKHYKSLLRHACYWSQAWDLWYLLATTLSEASNYQHALCSLRGIKRRQGDSKYYLFKYIDTTRTPSLRFVKATIFLISYSCQKAIALKVVYLKSCAKSCVEMLFKISLNSKFSSASLVQIFFCFTYKNA